MAFNYDKNKRSHDSGGDSFWTSYSDLFLGLSTIFLLLYVTSSLRTGTDALKNQLENQKLTLQNDELKNQLKMYESVKTDYLQNAAKDEQQEYQELMDKLTLLEVDAKNDKDRLARESLENDNKAKALNKYQQMVRNILNANKVAKTRLNARNEIIQEQDSSIETQGKEIKNLQQDINAKKEMIAKSREEIEHSKSALNTKMKELRSAYHLNKLTKQAFEKKTAAIQAESGAKLRALGEQQKKYEQQLGALSGDLQKTKAALNEKAGEAEKLAGQVTGLSGQVSGLKGQLGAVSGDLQKTKSALNEKAGEANKLAGQVSGLSGQVSGLKGQLKSTEGALAAAKEEMDARGAVAREIAKGFKAAGVKADIDMKTGEVVLDFGKNYFENDSAHLKPAMREVLDKAMPAYSKSLFGNPKIANKISAVEIIGFASPTYKGRFIDPSSSRAEDKAALKYNMDLSYRRANSIFTQLLDEKDVKFQHQKELLSLMKVSGRSFLEVMNVQKRGAATPADFCKVNDCKKAQRVIVRFSMDGKK